MRKNLNFSANLVSSAEEFEANIVSLADDKDLPKTYFILQRSTETEGDIDSPSELDSYFLELNSPDKSDYSEIEAASLDREKFEMIISDKNKNKNIAGIKKSKLPFQLTMKSSLT